MNRIDLILATISEVADTKDSTIADRIAVIEHLLKLANAPTKKEVESNE